MSWHKLPQHSLPDPDFFQAQGKSRVGQGRGREGLAAVFLKSLPFQPRFWLGRCSPEDRPVPPGL